MFLFAAALLAVVSAPTPAQYYARALDVMNALPQPASATYDLDMRANVGMNTYCPHPTETADSTAFSIGWGPRMKKHLIVHARYTLSGDRAEFQQSNGAYCRDDVALFKPEWASVDDWVRYGLLGTPAQLPKIPAATPAPAPAATIPTIATVKAIAPYAYRIYDMGARDCPNGSAGHALHLIARSDPDEHPLMDVVIERDTMRFCMMRFRLVGATVAGTGAKGDAALDFGESAGYWAVVHENMAISLRMLGAALKTFTFDFTFSNQQYN